MSLLGRLAIGVLLLLPLHVIGQTVGSVSGSVRDGSGSALSSVPLTLTGNNPSPVTLHVTTDQAGAFHFDHLPLGTYSVSTGRAGEAIAPSGPVVLSQSAPTLHLNLTLTSAAASPTKPPALQLQAAGIRGYIDPGGYSAPAGAAAASKLLQGAADLNRTGDNAEQATIACEHEPVLLKASLDHANSATAQRQLGRYYLATHQPEKALAPLQRAWLLDHHDPTTLTSLAQALLQTRQFAAAHDLLTANAAGADKPELHRLLARSQEGLGNFQQASQEYQAAAALEPSEADFYGAGYELILAGSAASARKVFESGTARYPESTTLLMGIGTTDFLLGQSAEATRIFLRCTTRQPGDARFYPFLSASFAISGSDPDQVEAAFRRFYEQAPGSAEAAYFYALVLLHRYPGSTNPGSADPATLLQQAIQLDPSFAKAHLQLGSVFFDRGQYPHAIEEFTAALRLDPEQWETHYRLSAAYRRTGQTGLAEQQMRAFLGHKNQKSTDTQLSDVHLEDFLSVLTRPNSKPNSTTPCLAAR